MHRSLGPPPFPGGGKSCPLGMVFVKSNEAGLQEAAREGVETSTKEGLQEAEQFYKAALESLVSAERAQIRATVSTMAANAVARAKAAMESAGQRQELIRQAITYTKPEARPMVGRVFVTTCTRWP